MSYPKQIISNIYAVNPALLDAPSATDTEDNILTKVLQNDLDLLFLEAADPLIEAFTMPDNLPVSSNPNNRWKIISSLQKAIRYDLIDDAMIAAHAACSIDIAAVRKRLGVIAIEDCLMGNPLGCCITLAALGHHKWRKKHGEIKVVVWLASMLAEGLSDRTAVNLLIQGEQNSTLAKADLVRESTADLLEAAQDSASFTYAERQAIIYALAGPERYQHASFPTTGVRRDKNTIPTLMAVMNAPLFMRYLSEKTASRVGEAMFHAFPLMHEMLDDNPETYIEHNPYFPEKVGGVLCAALDQHTREGKTAIRRFFKNNPALQPYARVMPEEIYDRQINNGVFHAEGGVLRSRVVYGDMCQQITDAARGPARFHFLGDFAHTYVETIRSQLADLNYYRSKA